MRFCKHDDWFAVNIVDYSKLNVLINDCENFNFTNKNCDVCKDEFSKTNGDYCCPKSFFAFDEKCREIEDFVLNCSNYNHDTQKCTECKNDYNLFEGVCCLENTFLNIKTFKCDIEIAFCKKFNAKIGICTECNENLYFSNGKCCPYGYYYDLFTKNFELIEISNCKTLSNNLSKLNPFN